MPSAEQSIANGDLETPAPNNSALSPLEVVEGGKPDVEIVDPGAPVSREREVTRRYLLSMGDIDLVNCPLVIPTDFRNALRALAKADAATGDFTRLYSKWRAVPAFTAALVTWLYRTRLTLFSSPGEEFKVVTVDFLDSFDPILKITNSNGVSHVVFLSHLLKLSGL